MIDCRPETRRERQAQIRDLRAKIASGVQSVSDRGRSVSYTNAQWLMGVLDRLENEEAYCMGQRQCRVFYTPMHKGL